MAFDLASLLDVTHLVTFLGGASIGAAGTYMADRFTDQRRNSESQAKNRSRFENLNQLMPEFFAEIRSDLKTQPEIAIREFVILPSSSVTFNHGQPRFQYYESQHPALKNYVSLLAESGYVDVVRSNGTPIYRLCEHFVALLQKH
ncbi:MAG: hypothetical protein EOO38_07920 [Cytophagaceae bacterium]|nr:MAG: hypothetical protein EOO38_07920 [Cytophagaceae bacterium]